VVGNKLTINSRTICNVLVICPHQKRALNLFPAIYEVNLTAFFPLMLPVPAPVFRTPGGYSRHPPPGGKVTPFPQPLPLNATRRNMRAFTGT
jgi:hypothetical protein